MEKFSIPLEEARSAYSKYSGAVAYIETRSRDGTVGIGTCFHVGDGVWVTARHVVDGREILQIDNLQVRLGRGPPINWSGPYFHPDDRVDIAALRISGIEAPVIQLGGHLDDWFGDEFILWPVLVMGYPPIPFTREPYLLAATGEINAIVERPHDVPHPHFIISGLARGGFSGGPVLALLPGGEFTFGLITESLGANHLPSELGYFAVITVEPILVCLGHHGLIPRADRELWGDLFDP